MAVGVVATVVMTYLTTKPLTEEEETEVWDKTRSIDNPLQPWPELYAEYVLH